MNRKVSRSQVDTGIPIRWGQPRANVACWDVSASGHVTRADQAFCRMLGRSKAEVIGQQAGKLAWPDDAHSISFVLNRLQATGKTHSLHQRFVRPNGQIVYMHNVFAPHKGDGSEFIGARVTSIDCTEQCRAELKLQLAHGDLEAELRDHAEQLERRAAQLARLAADLTIAEERERRRIAQILHDHLQQLLVSALFRLSMMENHAPELRRDLAQVQKLLEEANAESRSLTAELSPPILREGDLVAALRWLARWAHEHYDLEVELSVPKPVRTDREEVHILLFQCVRELLLNVVKHSGVHHANVVVERSGPRELTVTVKDGGKGFSLRQVERSKEKKCRGGFGLLSIRERLNFLGGSVQIRSRPGKGSIFILRVPIHEPAKAAPETAREPVVPVEDENVRDAPVAPGTSGKIRVLLADDHRPLVEGLRALIEDQADLEVAGVAADGNEAVEMVAQLRPDVVVIDYFMPALNGITATRQIHEDFPEIGIIGLSMYDGEEAAEAMYAAGASMFLTKSDKPERLLEMIRGIRKPGPH